MSKNVSGKWILDIRENQDEIWIGEGFYDTKDIAIEYGYQIAEREVLTKFRVGLCEEATNFGIDVDCVFDNIREAMYEEVGEVSDDYLEPTKEEALELEKELSEVFYKWQKKYNYEPEFFKVISEELITL
ncbi:hypothetical protein FDE77_17205 [Clostridium botulinum]|nr:hypothetical protein [Clostridium botulinum]